MKSEMLEGLNREQTQAVTFEQGPLLIIAGAGTGKTTVITRRIAWLIDQKLAKPEEILALTFTEKAATEMEERVDLLMPLGYVDLNISTFHAFAQTILRQHALDIGLPGDFQVITETEAWILIKQHLHDFDLDYYKPIGNPNRFIHALLKHFGKAKGEEITPEAYLKYAESLSLNNDDNNNNDRDPEITRIKEVANAYHTYQKLLLDNRFVDFGDLINYTLKLFRTRPKILKFYQDRFRFVLVDEFQDTDLSQYELVKLLAHPHDNITVVGDDDQSIYKFRGASVSNILQFKQDYPAAAEVALTKNYRSTQSILDLAYKFIQLNNPDRLESKLKINKKLVTSNKKQDRGEIQVIKAGGLAEETKLVVQKITELKQKENLSYNDFAVLVRANDSAEPFLDELNRRGIPFIYVANRGLYKKPFVQDLLSYLRVIDNHCETEDVYRVLTSPKFRLPHNDLVAITQTAKQKALHLFDVIRIPELGVSPESRSKIVALLALCEKHGRLAHEISASELLVRVVDDLGLIESLKTDSEASAEQRGLLEQFYKKCLEIESEKDDKSVKGMLKQIQLELEAGDQGHLSFNPEMGPEAVRVMTIHSAKGLEFEAVFLVNLVDQRFPTRERHDPIEIPDALVKEILPEGDAHLMEERRLFYVGVTRAKRFLYLTWALDYGGVANKKPSQFLVECGLEDKPSKSAPAGKVFFPQETQPDSRPPAPGFRLPVPNTFSYSQIATFLYSPLEYKYKYLYRLPLPGEAQLSFGITIHKTLEKFLQAVQQRNHANQADLFGQAAVRINIPEKKALLKFYQDCWVDDWFESKFQKEDYRKLGAKMLDNFYERYREDPKPIKFLEKKFKLKLGDYKFTGKIDRADLNPDGTIAIIDYKTGHVKEKLSADDKTQLLIYQWAAEEEFQERVESLKYWYLGSLGDTESFVGSRADIEEVKAKILDVIRQIVEAIRLDSFAELDKHKQDQRFRALER